MRRSVGSLLATGLVVGVVLTGTLTAPGRADGRGAPVAPAPVHPSETARAVPTGPAEAAACGSRPASAAGWDRVLGSLGPAWSGGDGAASTLLPDGRVLWLFGDTWSGGLSIAGQRLAGSRLVRNSVVVTQGRCAEALPTDRDALPGAHGTWLWPMHAVVAASGGPGSPATVVVLAQRVRSTGRGPFAFSRVGTAMIRLTVPWGGMPLVGTVRDLPASDVLWGAGILQQGSTTYVYGTRAVDPSEALGRELLVARVPTAHVDDLGSWRYRTQRGWSLDPLDAAVVRPAREGVSTVLGAVTSGTGVVLVTKPQEFLDDRVVALRSEHAWGPFSATTLFRSPSGERVPHYSPDVVAGSTPGGPAVVVVSRTTTSPELARRRPELTLPVFRDIATGL